MLLVEDFRDAVLESGHQITIQIHRDLDGRMAKALGDHLRLDAASDQHGRVSVAEVMEADLGKACSLQHSVEHIQHAIRRDGASIR
mgnify:CR=1 FL=1